MSIELNKNEETKPSPSWSEVIFQIPLASGLTLLFVMAIAYLLAMSVSWLFYQEAWLAQLGTMAALAFGFMIRASIGFAVLVSIVLTLLKAIRR